MTYKTYGGEYRGNCPLESQEQATFIDYLRKLHPHTFGKLCVHIKNEGKKTYGQANYDKKQGQNKGASDILIPGNPSFVMELKRKDRTKSKVQSGQIEYLEAAAKTGSFACIAYGCDAAIKAFKEWVDCQMI